MLPKGNVSKRHARLLYRDGRFIVTDLKSTNGTYVNGRKIAQATIVREGDKIYIGDFVLRIELGGDGAQPSAEAAPPHDEPSMDEASAIDRVQAPTGQAQAPFRGGPGMPPPLPGAPTAGPPAGMSAGPPPAIPQPPMPPQNLAGGGMPPRPQD